jgi:hypothetical protein
LSRPTPPDLRKVVEALDAAVNAAEEAALGKRAVDAWLSTGEGQSLEDDVEPAS